MRAARRCCDFDVFRLSIGTHSFAENGKTICSRTSRVESTWPTQHVNVRVYMYNMYRYNVTKRFDMADDTGAENMVYRNSSISQKCHAGARQ